MDISEMQGLICKAGKNCCLRQVDRRLIGALAFLLLCMALNGQVYTEIKGIVKDSVTQEALPGVSICLESAGSGTFSGSDGKFSLTAVGRHTMVAASLIGYGMKTVSVQSGTLNDIEICLAPRDRLLNQVLVSPRKEKYSKKNNPAVELVGKVIENKEKNSMLPAPTFSFREYERILFALDDYSPDKGILRNFAFLTAYTDTSLSGGSTILPFSLKEKLSDVFYRKQPAANRRIVRAEKTEGLDRQFNALGLDAVLAETFRDFSAYDNDMVMLFRKFVGPLNKRIALDFYRWYLSDTVDVAGTGCVKLDFAPANSADAGFTGSLYIPLDSSFAVKKALLRFPKKMNINFVKNLVVIQDYEKTAAGKWVPSSKKTALSLNMPGSLKFYVEKTTLYDRYYIGMLPEAVFDDPAPEHLEEGYAARNTGYWESNRPAKYSKAYKTDSLIDKIRENRCLSLILDAVHIIADGYIPLSGDMKKNKLDIGTVPTFYSFNSVEGPRFRLTLSSTKQLHPHIFFYGYGAYGTKDRKFKYYGETVWTFGKTGKQKDEFPRNNLTLAYKYDINTLGQRHTQAERDNVIRSLLAGSGSKLTYNRQMQAAYDREFYNGFSFKVSLQTFAERPASANVAFEKTNPAGNVYSVGSLCTTEATLALRYAPDEKFYQQRRRRHSVTSEKFVANFSYMASLRNILGGQYAYRKASLSVFKNYWIAPYGTLDIQVQAEKIWGAAPFPFLVTPNANNSYAIQHGSFALLQPLEFMHDRQIFWEANYHMGGWLFNRIPVIKSLKWREIIAFRGLIGALSGRNIPQSNNDLLLFPLNTHTANRYPYCEYNIGIENIFSCIRIDFVRRINYRFLPNARNCDFRVSCDLLF